MPRKAFILAAGEGRRMLPLTQNCPKPLLTVGGKCLIEHHIERLVTAGFREIVINVSYLGDMVEKHVGNGEKYGAKIQFSREESPLETGGGLLKALPLLGDEPFLLVNGDVWTDFPFASLQKREDVFSKVALGGAFLFLVDNPQHNPAGDFAFIRKNGMECESLDLKDRAASGQTWTFSGISVLSRELIEQYPQKRERFPLLEAFQYAIVNERLFGESYSGLWIDVGTPQRLEYVNRLVVESDV